MSIFENLTVTQIEHMANVKKYGYLTVTEGPEYAVYQTGPIKMNKSSFDALKKEGAITRIDSYKGSFLICSVWKITEKGINYLKDR